MEHFNTIYLDNNSTTPVDPRVKEEIKPFLKEKYGNPNSLHRKGTETRKAIEEARKKVASLIKASEKEIYFTSGATEANNLAVKGTALERRDEGTHIITTKVEHDCIIKACESLEKQGFEVTYLEPDENGVIKPDKIRENLREDTILVSVMMANNEIGSLQPIKEIGKILSKTDTYFHTDAAQALGKIPVDARELGVDMLTLNAHKMYGPKGIGALWKKRNVRLEPLIHGGGQENGLRSGTENVPYIAGFGKAAELAEKELEKDRKKLERLTKKLLEKLDSRIDDWVLNGPDKPKERLPGNLNVSFHGVEGEALMLKLDDENIQVSTGSACASESLEPSHVLSAIDKNPEVAHSSIRIGLGRFNTEKDVEKLAETLPDIVESLRQISSIKTFE